MNNPNDEYPKTPPFVMREHSDGGVNHLNVHHPPVPPARHAKVSGLPLSPSDRGLLNIAIFLISALSMGIALLGGAWLGIGVLTDHPENPYWLFAGILADGIAYAVGCAVGLFGVRMMGNFIVPIFMKVYAWIVLLGISVLQIVIIAKLLQQDYNSQSFLKYVILFCAGIIALVGVHLIIEDHDLVKFSFPILFISLIHLYFIVYQYVIVGSFEPKDFCYSCVLPDILFFLLTGGTGGLMLAHLGLLSGIRKVINRFFKEKTTPLVPPS